MITYLYHKRHKQTGLNYFGKTIRDPYVYRGSGSIVIQNALRVTSAAGTVITVSANEKATG
jgi:hypothetical protein